MDWIEEIPIRRFEGGRARAVADKVIVEARVELDVNDGQARLAMLCLPRDLEALAAGFLVGEGALRRREELESIEVGQDGVVRVRGDLEAEALEALSRRWTWGSGCGSGGTARDLDGSAFAPAPPGPVVTAEALIDVSRRFQAAADLWKQTGGVHACALAEAGGVVLFAEDVGRHNAFDKVVGRAFLDGLDLGGKFVLMTGRLSAEIVSKAVACRVGLLVSRSAVTALAVRLARRFGVTLVGFLRGRRLNVYTGFERIAPGSSEAGAAEIFGG